MIKHMALIVLFVTAVLFTMGGQGLAYFLEEQFDTGYPVYYLTGLFVAGSMLFVVAITLTNVLTKRNILWGNHSFMYLSFGYMVGISSILWSFFVLVMWWG